MFVCIQYAACRYTSLAGAAPRVDKFEFVLAPNVCICMDAYMCVYNIEYIGTHQWLWVRPMPCAPRVDNLGLALAPAAAPAADFAPVAELQVGEEIKRANERAREWASESWVRPETSSQRAKGEKMSPRGMRHGLFPPLFFLSVCPSCPCSPVGYGVATISRLLKITGLSCKRAL